MGACSALFSFLIFSAGTVLHASEPSLEAAKLAEAAGIKSFPGVSSIAFTFNVQLPDKKMARSWVWNVKTDEVTDKSTGQSYSRKNLSDKDKEADAKFINDKYWLIFPFQLIWDKGTVLSLSDKAEEAPLSQKAFNRMTVQYSSGGYTPGDAYDLYYDESHLIREWVFRKGGVATPTRLSSWEGYQKFNGLIFSTDRVGPDGFRIWFTDVEVT
jgi:hypothetical protein